jgi:hypothetical protein
VALDFTASRWKRKDNILFFISSAIFLLKKVGYTDARKKKVSVTAFRNKNAPVSI